MAERRSSLLSRRIQYNAGTLGGSPITASLAFDVGSCCTVSHHADRYNGLSAVKYKQDGPTSFVDKEIWTTTRRAANQSVGVVVGLWIHARPPPHGRSPTRWCWWACALNLEPQQDKRRASEAARTNASLRDPIRLLFLAHFQTYLQIQGTPIPTNRAVR